MEILGPAGGPDLDVSVFVDTNSLRLATTDHSERHFGVEFGFIVKVPDVNDLESVVEVLKLEASYGGALRLLRIIVEAMVVEGRISLRLQVRRVGPREIGPSAADCD